uniref:Uncharacterized protein n=1 Tax=Oryza meridionalis TaxID=40149 RepID=A0A0E0CKQ9_9ORYZ
MGSSSKATASNPLGGSTILEKLSKTNHAILGLVRGAHLEGHLTGTTAAPTAIITKQGDNELIKDRGPGTQIQSMKNGDEMTAIVKKVVDDEDLISYFIASSTTTLSRKTEPMINFWERHTPSGSALSSAWPVDKPLKCQSIWPIEDVAANRAGTMATMTTGTMEATTVQTATEIMETVPPAGAKEELIPGASANSAIKEDIYTNLGIYFSLIQICGTST